MKQVMRELKAIAKKHGYKVRIYTYTALKDDTYIRFFSPRFPSGDFEQFKKSIVIRKYKNTFLKSVIKVLAHEIGHLMHTVEGKYLRYYSSYWDHEVSKYYSTHKIPDKLNISCFLQGVRAERDCDKWASRFLVERGYAYDQTRLYPARSVMGYELYTKYMRRHTYILQR